MPSKSTDNPLTVADIVGITVGSFAMLVMIIFMLCRQRWKDRRRKRARAILPYAPDASKIDPYQIGQISSTEEGKRSVEQGEMSISSSVNVPTERVTPYTVGLPIMVEKHKSRLDIIIPSSQIAIPALDTSTGTNRSTRENQQPRSMDSSERRDLANAITVGDPVRVEEEDPGIPDDPHLIQRIFEDRRFEHQLLSFISQRMDAPRQDVDEAEGSIASPPTYQGPHNDV